MAMSVLICPGVVVRDSCERLLEVKQERRVGIESSRLLGMCAEAV